MSIMMRKFWGLMLALTMVLCISGCSTIEDDIMDSAADGLYLIASIEHTRTDVVYEEGAWHTVWSGDDRLYVTSDNGDFVFTNTPENPNRFEPEDESAEVLRDASNIVITTLHEEGGVVDSDAGKRGLALRGEYESLPKCGRVTLYVESAFFRLSCSEEVTLMADAAIFSGAGDSGDLQVRSVTVAAGDDIWVAFTPCVDKTSLTVAVAGATVMVVEDIAVAPCIIYNLGDIVPKPEPEPEPEPEPQETYVYLVPNDDWKGAGAWFAAYFWEGDNSMSVELVENSDNGIYKAAVPAGMTNIIFCRMNPAYVEFGWNSGTEQDHIWAQTANLVVGVAPYNYYYITGKDTGEWNLADYKPAPPVVDVWAVAGTFNGWGDELMSATDVANVYVKRGLELRWGDEFKVKIAGSWDRNYGGIEDIILTPNLWLTGYQDGDNITVAYSGVYDVYLDSAKGYIYLMNEGVDYTTAKEYGSDDGTVAPSTDIWGLCGTHNGWGKPDIPLMWDGVLNLYVAYNAKLTGEFKVRANNSWDTNYGYEGEITVDDPSGVTMEKSAGNCNVDSGTYDVYFSLTSLQLWIKTPGSKAPVVDL